MPLDTTDSRTDDRSVVVGYDGSPDSVVALQLAGADADATGSPVLVVVVMDDRTPPPRPRRTEGIDATAAAHLLYLARAGLLARHPDLDVRTRMVRGPVSLGLLQAASGARLLAVGARGAGHEFSPAWGEVAGGVTALSDCPVLVVHAGSDLLEVSAGRSPRVLIALTDEPFDETVLSEGLALARRLTGLVHVLTVPAARDTTSWSQVAHLDRDGHLLDCQFYADHVEAVTNAVACADVVVARSDGREALDGLLPDLQLQAVLARLPLPVLAVPAAASSRARPALSRR